MIYTLHCQLPKQIYMSNYYFIYGFAGHVHLKKSVTYTLALVSSKRIILWKTPLFRISMFSIFKSRVCSVESWQRMSSLLLFILWYFKFETNFRMYTTDTHAFAHQMTLSFSFFLVVELIFFAFPKINQCPLCF